MNESIFTFEEIGKNHGKESIEKKEEIKYRNTVSRADDNHKIKGSCINFPHKVDFIKQTSMLSRKKSI